MKFTKLILALFTCSVFLGMQDIETHNMPYVQNLGQYNESAEAKWFENQNQDTLDRLKEELEYLNCMSYATNKQNMSNENEKTVKVFVGVINTLHEKHFNMIINKHLESIKAHSEMMGRPPVQSGNFYFEVDEHLFHCFVTPLTTKDIIQEKIKALEDGT